MNSYRGVLFPYCLRSIRRILIFLTSKSDPTQKKHPWGQFHPSRILHPGKIWENVCLSVFVLTCSSGQPLKGLGRDLQRFCPVSFKRNVFHIFTLRVKDFALFSLSTDSMWKRTPMDGLQIPGVENLAWIMRMFIFQLFLTCLVSQD